MTAEIILVAESEAARGPAETALLAPRRAAR